MRRMIAVMLALSFFTLGINGLHSIWTKDVDSSKGLEQNLVMPESSGAPSSHGGDWNDSFTNGGKIASERGIGITNEGAEIPHLLIFDDFVAANGATPNPYFWSLVGVGTDASDIADVQGQKLSIALTMSGSYNSLGVKSSDPMNSNSYNIDANFTVYDTTDEDANITISADPFSTPYASVVISSAAFQATVLTKQSNNYIPRATSSAFFSVGTEYHYHLTVTSTTIQVLIKRCSDLAIMWDSGQITMDSMPFDNSVSFSCSGTSGIGDTRFDNITIENTLVNAWLRSEIVPIPQSYDWDILYIDKTELQSTTLAVTIYDANADTPVTGFIGLTTDGEVDISSINSVSVSSIYLNASFTGTGSRSPILHIWGLSWNLPGVWRRGMFPSHLIQGIGTNMVQLPSFIQVLLALGMTQLSNSPSS